MYCSKMRNYWKRMKIKYFIILGVVVSVTVYFLLLKEKDTFSISRENLVQSVREPKGWKAQYDNNENLDFSYKFPSTDRKVLRENELLDENSLKYKRGSQVNVYVVEEHHEVIPYWFEAAYNGVIPKSGNSLIHIDGHSDMAPPAYISGYPMFKWPKRSQLKYLLQANDAFIQASAMTGLISRLIWVWPDWDSPNHDEQYIRVPVRLGWFWESNDTDTESFCMCATLNNTYLCRSMTDLGLGDDEYGFELPLDQCNIKTTFIFEEFSESYAERFFKRPFSLDDDSHVLLDIDEDYYGCTYAIMPLLNANITIGRVKHLNKRISALFCPKTTDQDHNIDKILYSVIELFHLQRRCNSPNSIYKMSSCANGTDEFIRHFLVSEIVRKNKSSVINLCQLKLTTMPVLLNGIFKVLKGFNDKQLQAIQEVGFCSSTSPKTYSDENGYMLCIGANTPSSTAVYIHKPTPFENKERTKRLRKILKSIPDFSPKLVTVSRSVRDGYTPREYFEGIEDDILTTLKSTFETDVNVQYDVDLLGGAAGWPARRKSLKSALKIS